MNTVIKRINENFQRLSPSQKTVAHFVLQNHQQLADMTARDLAERTHTVPSSIISFSKKLGYKGFNELKFSYVHDEQNLQTIDNEIIQALLKAEEVAKKPAFKEAVNLLMDAPKIFIMAFQMSQIPAKDFYFRMRKIEPAKMIFFDSYIDQQRMSSLMSEDDIVLIVSNSGESEELLKIENDLKKRKCKQILVTNGINSSLAKFATVELSIGCLENNPILFKEVPTKARYALICLLEKIYLELLNNDYDEKMNRIKCASHYLKGPPHS